LLFLLQLVSPSQTHDELGMISELYFLKYSGIFSENLTFLSSLKYELCFFRDKISKHYGLNCVDFSKLWEDKVLGPPRSIARQGKATHSNLTFFYI
jgi:hypothetical protein